MKIVNDTCQGKLARVKPALATTTATRTSKKQNAKTTPLLMHQTFDKISLLSLHDWDVKLMEDINTRRGSSFVFFRTRISFLRIQLQEISPTSDKLNEVE